MVRLVDELERDGLVRRQPDPADRRARIITATDRGAELCAIAQQEQLLVDQHVLGNLEPAERQEFVRLLRRIVVRLLDVDPTHGAAACEAARQQIESHEDAERAAAAGGAAADGTAPTPTT
ncbi:hypothetical protein FAIPA1_30018 [Frankia sp. AiPs1]|nr:MarR family transcriptional regulator [Frankia sp. AiPa1]